MSVETFALMNLLMNGVIIAIIARSKGRVRWGNVGFAAAFGALYALAMNTKIFYQLNALPAKLLLALAMSVIAFPSRSAMGLVCNCLWLVAGTALLAGVIDLTWRFFGVRNLWTFAMGAMLGSALLSGFLLARGRRLERFDVRVQIAHRGHTVLLDALVDTGNRLHEPLSGLPVLIVSEQRLRALKLPGRPEETLPPGFRLVGYGALGGQGKMACFLPEELWVSYGRQWLYAPDVWVAIYPDEIPGDVEALAPPVIGRIQPAGREHHSIEGSRKEWSIRRDRW